jgi:hypothetical protein
VTVRLTVAERKRLEHDAERAGQELSAYVREQLTEYETQKPRRRRRREP